MKASGTPSAAWRSSARLVAAAIAAAISLPCTAVAADAVSDVRIDTFASWTGRGRPPVVDSQVRVEPAGTVFKAESIVAGFLPVPGLPTSTGSGFGSAAAESTGVFGVGVHAFFNSARVPPEEVLARGSFAITFTNTMSVVNHVRFSFVVPPPNIQIVGQGVGDFFPAGADPSQDVTGLVQVRITTRLHHLDGSVDEGLFLDYGMEIVRDPITGVQNALGFRDAAGKVERFDVSLQHRDFQLPGLTLADVTLADYQPGESFEFGYSFIASGSTGFGETGIFAAIGDPFSLSTGGLTALAVTTAVPEPSALALTTTGLLLMGVVLLRRRVGLRLPAGM